MLLYQPPFLVVDRLTLYPDHLDPDTFYYVVSVPELARDGSEPSIWATAVLGAVSVTGTEPPTEDVARVSLSFDVTLAPTAAELALAEEKLKERRGRERVRLAPAPLSGGKALLTVARPATPEAEREIFVHSGHPPSLVGDNRAAFAVAAEGREARILAAAIQAGHLAAIVAYELDFLGLAPSFRARMTVRWDMVYAHFTERSVEGYVIYSDELDRTIDSLAETRAVEVHVEELDPEAKAEATKALWNELKTRIVDKMFESAYKPGESPVEERIGRGVREVLSSLLPGYHHVLRKLDQAALGETVITLSEQSARIYHHNPQTTLAGMVQRAGARARLVVAREDDLPDRVEEVRVESSPGLSRLGIRRVLVDVRAVDERGELMAEGNYTFDGSETAPQVFRVRRRGIADPRIRWRAEVYFDADHAPDGRERWTFDWRDLDGARVYFSPEEWLDVTTLRIEVDDPAIFTLPAKVEMTLEARLADQERAYRTEHMELGPDATSRVFSVVVPHGTRAVLSGTEVLRRPNEPEVRRRFDAIEGPVHRITNPFARAWRMEVRAAASWQETEALVAELRVWEPQRGIWLRAEHRFTEVAPVYILAFATSEDTPLEAQARLTRITRASGVVRGPWIDLVGRVVRITDEVQALRRIRVTLRAPRFVEARVRRVKVELSYTTPGSTLGAPDRLTAPSAPNPDGATLTSSMTFSRDGEHQDWIHPFVDPTKPAYRWRAVATSEDNERWTHPSTEAVEDDLEIVLPDQPFTG